MYFSSAGTYRFTLKGRGKSTLYLSFDNGVTWVNALTIDRASGNAYVASENYEKQLTTKNNYVYFKVVHNITQANTFFGIGVSSKKADGNFSDIVNASGAITNASAELDKIIKEQSSQKFETEYHFRNEYTYGYAAEDKVSASGNKLVSVSHNPWDDTRKIEFLFDGKADTWYHSEKDVYITEDKPFELVVDLGSLQTVNRVTFYGYNGKLGNNGMVNDFKLYGSTDGKNFDMLLLDVKDAPTDKRDMGANFNTVNIRYYKLIVTDTDNHRYLAMNRIEFSNNVNFQSGKIVSPSDFFVRYIGKSWGTENALCNYGIIYTANAGDSVEYHFTGSRVAYFAERSADYGTVDIYIDGKLVAKDVDLSANNYAGATSTLYDRYNYKYNSDTLAYIYTGDALSDGDHVLKIVGKSGKFNVESFTYWN